MDVFVAELGGFVSVIEIKATDWDRIKPKNITKNLSAHRRQVWKYIEKYLSDVGVDVCGGIIYPSTPTSPSLKERIEEYLSAHGLQALLSHKLSCDSQAQL